MLGAVGPSWPSEVCYHEVQQETVSSLGSKSVGGVVGREEVTGEL